MEIRILNEQEGRACWGEMMGDSLSLKEANDFFASAAAGQPSEIKAVRITAPAVGDCPAVDVTIITDD